MVSSNLLGYKHVTCGKSKKCSNNIVELCKFKFGFKSGIHQQTFDHDENEREAILQEKFQNGAQSFLLDHRKDVFSCKHATTVYLH